MKYIAEEWIDREEYPFASRGLEMEEGTMRYVDEGQGRPVVLVHGTPDWSFGWRHLIKCLSPQFRCVAPDHLGFGLSDKPRDASYHPSMQAKNLRRLIETLELEDVTLVLHDFGGPFGLAYAVEQPENVRSLVLMNTWMWSLRGDPHYDRVGRLFGGALGRFLYLRMGFSARFVMRQAYGDRAKLTPHIHRHYLRPLSTPEDRVATWAYARHLLGASDWYEKTLWERRDRLRNKPALILWGMKDIAFRAKELARLETAFPDAKTVRFEDAGHFPQEEKPEAVCAEVREFLSR